MVSGTHNSGGQQGPLEPAGQSQRLPSGWHWPGRSMVSCELRINCFMLGLVSTRGEPTTRAMSGDAKNTARARRMLVSCAWGSDQQLYLCIAFETPRNKQPKALTASTSNNISRVTRTTPLPLVSSSWSCPNIPPISAQALPSQLHQ